MSELKRYHDDKDIGLVERKDGSWMRSERCIEEIAKLKELVLKCDLEIADLRTQLENDHKLFRDILFVFGSAQRFTKDFRIVRTVRKLLALREAAK